MNRKLKERLLDIALAISLMALAAGLIALGVVAFLFQTSDITAEWGFRIGWVCFVIIIGYFLRVTVFEKVPKGAILHGIKRIKGRRLRQKITNRRYEAFKAQREERAYKAAHRPFCEMAFGEEIH